MKRLPAAGYVLVLAVHIWAGGSTQTDGASTLLAVSKPLLLIYLMVWFAFTPKTPASRAFAAWIAAGLFASWLGDVLLMFQERDGLYFLLGLGAFLVAHIAYIFAFTRTYRNDYEEAILRKQGWLLVLVVGYGVYFFSRLSPNLGGMVAPVMLYTLAITLMLLMALQRWGKVCKPSFWWITGGAVLFLASDSILAWNKFVYPVDHGHALIMGTYGVAQLSIFLGARGQLLDQLRQARALQSVAKENRVNAI